MELVQETLEIGELSGAFEFKVQNYFRNVVTRTVGTSWISPVFNLCKRMWSLEICPQGNKDESKDYIAIFLGNEEDSDVVVSYTFSLVNHAKGCDSFKLPPLNKKLTKKGSGPTSQWGYHKIMKQSLLTDVDSPYILNDTVIFRVEISVPNDVVIPKSIVKYAPELSDCWLTFWMATIGTDITLVVCFDEENSVQIPAHKPVLMARSEVFKAMFTHNMSESNTNEIVISDFSPEVVREMLHFMYTDKLQSETLDSTVYEGLLGAAIKYDVPGLINLCEAHFGGQLCDDNVVKTLILAESCGAADLKRFTVDYIRRNSHQLVNRADFLPLLDRFSQHLLGQSVAKKRKITESCGNDGKTDSGCVEDDSCLIM